MKIEKLQFLKIEIEKDFFEEQFQFSLYFEKNEKWYSLNENREATGLEFTSINISKNEEIAYHKARTTSAWYFILDLNCALEIKFPSSPKIEKRKKYKEKIDLILERAENSFKVTHNPLTLLLARDAFYCALSNAIKLVNAMVPGAPDEQEIAPRSTLAAFALDIDYFKQVNDTYGHIYGDQILKIFAKRLETTANKLKEKFPEKATITLGHPSGEEFLILIFGNNDIDEILSFADQFRIDIADEALPSAEEWDSLLKQENLSIITLPPIQERSIKTSIGVAIHSLTALPSSGVDEVKFLLDRADTALSKAKAYGKNQVVLFDKIIESYGRVLEQEKNTRVVAIDIGSDVGVTAGQEFTVYPPTFTGNKKFSINDGRTTRVIGVYPKVPLTRITIFNVQPELAFGYISNSEEKFLDIESGSSLEAIPIGSIANILPYSSKYFTSSIDSQSITDISTLKIFVKEQSEKKHKPFAVIFKFIRDQEYLKKYGGAALNVAITQLYRKTLIEMQSINNISLLDASSLCFVGLQSQYNEENINNIIDNFCNDFPELGIASGIFCQADLEEWAKNNKTILDSQFSIEFAQFAASGYGRLPGSKITHFNHQTALRLLRTQKDAATLITAKTDFENLKKLGVITSDILNFGGLIYSGLKDKEKALEHYELAIIKNPKNPIFRSNLALITRQMGDTNKSLNMLNAISDEDIEKLITSHHYGIFVYAITLTREIINNPKAKTNEKRLKRVISSALSYDEYKEKYLKDRDLMKNILEKTNSLE
ncbi:diguanylate cyclase [Janthinobacterium sp. GMG1]|uniref:diguanylate cyclase n=1 Tax=Janthinobacterium sp. GMG1 TaxID=3096007 RepID=UPI002ACA2397|nr:diguanylate cyclase [Janthinobacterium sp. GMG1]MDZ5633678.1 diguanylate cyclase [Janthinobacterium sp. GMG1]